MQATNMTEWPKPVWPSQKMEESRKLAWESPDSFHGALACVRVLAATEDGMTAARQKLATVRAESDARPLGSGELRQIIPIALLIHDQTTALHFLAKVFDTTVDLSFAVAQDPVDSVVWMQIVRQSAKFIISDSLFRNEHGEYSLQRLVDVYPILAYYLESSLRSDGSVAINLGDLGLKPGLAFCDNRPGSFLIPDSIFMDYRGYNAMREHFTRNFLPWEKRLPTAFWRGTTTGRPLDPKQGWRTLPRVRLCEIGAVNIDIMDAGITKITQIADPEAEPWIAAAGLLRPFVLPESFQQYKYQIDIDGNTTSWPGLFIKLLTGSVVLKVPPRDGFEQWYYDRLKPWENFIPLAPDMSDLPEKIRWLRANDRVAQTIGAAGYRLAEDLTYEREIARAAPTVAAAVKDASGQPLLDFDFAVGGSGVAHLREGWMLPEQYGVDAVGFESRIDLPATRGIGGFVLGLEVSPLTSVSQRLSVALDGDLLRQQRISGRTSLYIPVARKAFKNKAQLTLTLLHPDAVPAASAASPANPRMLAIRLHRLWVFGQGRTDPDESLELAEAFGELRRLDQGESSRDLVDSSCGDIMSVSRRSIGITADFLAGKVFQLLRVDNGDPLAESLSFAAEGRLLGYQVGRHSSWEIVEGNLVFRNHHNEMTDVFDRLEILGTSVSLVGRLHMLEDDYWIRLVEQPRLDPGALVSFRSNAAPDAGRSSQVAVLVRSHKADEKFDELIAKLSRNRKGFDLYAMLDTTREPITTQYSDTIYFNAASCGAMGLARPHPALFHQYGDVAMSFACRKIPDYAFYIMIDDDVDLLEDDASLFNDITRAVTEQEGGIDLLGLLYAYRPLTTHGFYLHKMIPENMLRYCYYPFIGLSARAAAFVFSQRQLEYARGNGLNERPMCEIFVPSLLHAAGFVCKDLAQVVPGAYSADGMMLQLKDPGCGRPMGYDRSEFGSERMIHPVYTHTEFVARLRSRFHVDQPEERDKILAILEGPFGTLLPETTRATVLSEAAATLRR